LNDRIGELLVQKNLLSEEQLRRAKEEARTSGTRIGYQITKLGFVEEEKVAEAVSNQYGVPTIELDDFEVDSEVIALIPEEVANKHTILPVNRAGSTLIVAMSDPSNIFAIDDLKFLTGYNVEVVVAAEEAIRRAIDRYYDKGADLDEVMAGFDDQEFEVVGDEEGPNLEELEKAVEDAPVVKLANLILTDAIKKVASDIHIEPYEKDFRVRYRITS